MKCEQCEEDRDDVKKRIHVEEYNHYNDVTLCEDCWEELVYPGIVWARRQKEKSEKP